MSRENAQDFIFNEGGSALPPLPPLDNDVLWKDAQERVRAQGVPEPFNQFTHAETKQAEAILAGAPAVVINPERPVDPQKRQALEDLLAEGDKNWQ